MSFPLVLRRCRHVTLLLLLACGPAPLSQTEVLTLAEAEDRWSRFDPERYTLEVRQLDARALTILVP